MIQGKLLSYGDDLSEVKHIMNEVFPISAKVDSIINSSQKIFDIENEFVTYVIVYDGINYKNSVAVGSMIYDGTKCMIDKVGVLKSYRRQKYGDFAVRMLLNRAFTSGIQQVHLYASINDIKFFESIGFKLVGDNINYDKIDNNVFEMKISNLDLVYNCKKSL